MRDAGKVANARSQLIAGGLVERSTVVLGMPWLQQVPFLTNPTFPKHPGHLLLPGSSLQQVSASFSFSQTSLCKPPNGPYRISSLSLEEILPPFCLSLATVPV